MAKQSKPSGEEVKKTREAAGLTQREAAERFGYALRGWQSKEDEGPSGRSLSIGEFELLQLLAGLHPDYELSRRS
ncbi:hypothetical protein R9X49_21965 [Pectobacterium carotovorum]|nr:hypothetical protein [Pectobacterium carotovorum]MDX6917765.1 hypothetical protein [Pectobacterium carotovorum]